MVQPELDLGFDWCKTYPHLFKRRALEGVPGSPGKIQKEGQEDQEEVNELGGPPWDELCLRALLRPFIGEFIQVLGILMKP